MSNEILVLAISGFSGGNQGPQGVYNHLQKHWNNKAVTVLQVDTVPESVEANVDQISQIALEQGRFYKQIYVVGYSMGGAVAVQVAHRLKDTETPVNGMALLATQTDGLQGLNELSVPVLFYHGREDSIFRPWEVESVYKRYMGPKKMVQVEGLGHSLAHEGKGFVSKSYVNNLAKDIIAEISTLHSEAGREKTAPNDRIFTKEIPLGLGDRFLNWILSLLCACTKKTVTENTALLEPIEQDVALPPQGI